MLPSYRAERAVFYNLKGLGRKKQALGMILDVEGDNHSAGRSFGDRKGSDPSSIAGVLEGRDPVWQSCWRLSGVRINQI